MSSLPHTPGPWHYAEGYVRDSAGNALASIPYTLGDFTDRANGELMAAAPELLEACRFALDTLDKITTEQFSQGADKPARAKLAQAIEPFAQWEQL